VGVFTRGNAAGNWKNDFGL